MVQFADYLIEEKIYESSRTAVYRGQKSGDPQKVIIKMLQPAHAAPESIARFRREFELTHQLQGSSSIQTFDLIEYDNTLAMVLEDFGGISLAQALKGSCLDTAVFLPLALEICNALASIHQQNLIHKDINPANIVWNKAANIVKIIDFGLATSLPREKPEISSPNVLEGTLAYISPEQTGRMNRAMDYRSDFYSLGVSFYQLLTGQLPFSTADAAELVHAHIARQPSPLSALNAAVPQLLSDIVMRLLAKNAEDRYQSTFGLAADLETCWQQWQANGRLTPFPLAQKDTSPRFQLPQKLYGRAAEIEILHNAFQRIANPESGAAELILVTGQAGIGKSALVQELFKPVTASKGTFISGKFDQLQNVPYAPLLQAFNSLLNQILAESSGQIAAWQHALQQALGANAQILLEAMPILELIIGPQTAVTELPPSAAENRFNLTFQNFITVFAQPEHPLVLFLDDWQWLDGASRQLLQSLLTMGSTRHLLLIGAFRDDEISSSHPVRLLLEKIAQAGTAVTTLPLHTLPLTQLNKFVADTLHTTPAQSQSLANLLLHKTDGNPFFLGEFLKSLQADGFISFDFAQGKWRWDFQQIQEQDMTDNVVNLMMANIQKLAANTQTSLTLAACIGNRFALSTLALVLQKPSKQTAVDLWPAIQTGLIIPLNEAYKLAAYNDTLSVTYKFSHDRIQQAAYSLIPQTEQQAVHWQIGSHLLPAIADETDHGRLFEVVNQLNLGRQQISTPAESKQLTELNLKASQAAIESTAFQAAYEYSLVGLELLNQQPDPWQTDYDLSLQLFTTAVSAAFQSNHFTQMAQLAHTALEKTDSLRQQIPIYTNIFLAYLAQNKINEAVDESLPLLKKLGVDLPSHPTQRHLVTAVLKTQFSLRGKTSADLLNLPLMSDPQQIAIIEILTSVSGAAYFARPQLFGLMVLKMVQIFAKYGNHPAATRVYVAYGLMQAGFLNKFKKGVALGQLGLDLAEKLHAREQYPQTAQLYYHFLCHWQSHLSSALEPMQEAYQISLETGNLIQATYCAYSYSTHAFYSGRPLDILIPEMEQYSNAMQQLHQAKIRYVQQMYLQIAANLNNPANETPWLVNGRFFNETEGLAAYKQANDQPAYCTFLIQKGILNYLFAQTEQAKTLFDEAQAILRSIPASYQVPLLAFYSALTYLTCVKQGHAPRNSSLKQVKKQLKKLKDWSELAPMNFQHKYELVAAELAALEGDHNQARQLYESALDHANVNGFIQEEALAYELAGSYFLERENGRLAKYHLKQAHQAYILWGAHAKAKQLEAQYSQYFSKETYKPGILPQTIRNQQTTSSTIATTNVSGTAVLDLSSVIKASQALSSEIKLADLLNNLMTLVIENAGAQAGYLLLLEAEQWHIAAYGGEAAPDAELPASILNYVSRSRETIVLADAAAQGQFTQDPLILSQKPKSVLCLPLIHQREVSGILYLQNNLTSGAFTPERLTVLNLLASQAAISIENARLVAQLEDYGRNLQAQVDQRTIALASVNQQAQAARALAEQANENKSLFLSNMSHEMRTPLNTIIGFTRLVKQKGRDSLPEKQENNLNKVLVSADHLLGLINTVIDIAKIEAGGMDVKAIRFDPVELSESCLVTTQPLLKRGVTLHKNFAADCPTIYSDPAKIKQILINLLSNAAKFTHEGQITVSMTHYKTQWQIAISDSGIGISSDSLPRIFEEFEQAESTTRQNYGGTGLGLPISLGLARLLGGDLSASSQLGQGSTFTLTLPLHYSASSARTEHQ